MSVSLKDPQAELVEASPVGERRPWWEKPALILVLALTASLMLFWLVFLLWIGKLLLFAIWP